MYANRTQERSDEITEKNPVIRLMRYAEAGKLTTANRIIAESLARQWSERGLTNRQERLAYGIAITVWRETNGPDSERPERPHAPWWHDRSPQRQAVRGVKSGVVRRKLLAPRNRRIHALRQKGTPLRVLAETFALSARQIMRILRDMAAGTFDTTRRTIVPKVPLYVAFRGFLNSFRCDTNHVESTPLHPPAAIPSTCRGRSKRIYTSLTRWLGLRNTRTASYESVIREADRLNALEPRPLKPPAVRRAARNAWTASRRWVTV